MAYTKRYIGNADKNSLSDRDILLDVLMTEKYLSQVYDTAVMESSTDDVFDIFQSMQHDEHQNARVVFNFMKEQGWYSTREVEQSSFRRGNRYANKTNSDYAVTSGARNFGGRLNARH